MRRGPIEDKYYRYLSRNGGEVLSGKKGNLCMKQILTYFDQYSDGETGGHFYSRYRSRDPGCIYKNLPIHLLNESPKVNKNILVLVLFSIYF